MTWQDVSLPIRDGMPVWPGDPAVRLEAVSTVQADGCRVTRLHLGSHSGTHIDAPSHFIEGAAGVDAIPLAHLVGPCRVLDLREVAGAIGADHLRTHAPQRGERILLRTSNDLRALPSDYIALDASAGEFLAQVGIALVGIDALSIERAEGTAYPVHMALLSGGIIIVEGVDLSGVAAGIYDLIALPLRLEGLDGSPARVLLRRR